MITASAGGLNWQTDSLAERETTQTLSLRNKHKTQKKDSGLNLWEKQMDENASPLDSGNI